jgi:hypothetical protein
MFRSPLEIEIYLEARQADLARVWQEPRVKTNERGLLARARHVVGMVFIITGDHIAGDHALSDRAQAREQAAAPVSA